MDYPITCPYCGDVVDSHDSYADSRQLLREHLDKKHPMANAKDDLTRLRQQRCGERPQGHHWENEEDKIGNCLDCNVFTSSHWDPRTSDNLEKFSPEKR